MIGFDQAMTKNVSQIDHLTMTELTLDQIYYEASITLSLKKRPHGSNVLFK
jgi:hypothetical protein